MTPEEQASEFCAQARSLEAEQRWDEAAALYRKAYAIAPNAFRAGRLIHCLRKQGVAGAREACLFAREPRKRWPEDLWLRREYVWAVYDGYLKAEEAPDDEEAESTDDGGLGSQFELMKKAARRILDVTDEELPRRLAVFAIGKAAKKRGQWEAILEFLPELRPEELSNESGQFDGHPIPRHRLKW